MPVGENGTEEDYKLPVGKVILDAFIVIRVMRAEFLNKVAIPVGVLIALSYLEWFMTDRPVRFVLCRKLTTGQANYAHQPVQ